MKLKHLGILLKIDYDFCLGSYLEFLWTIMVSELPFLFVNLNGGLNQLRTSVGRGLFNRTRVITVRDYVVQFERRSNRTKSRYEPIIWHNLSISDYQNNNVTKTLRNIRIQNDYQILNDVSFEFLLLQKYPFGSETNTG